MDHLTIIMAAGKSLFVASGNNEMQIVARNKIVTRTGVQLPLIRPKRQQLYLTLPGPLLK